MTASAAPEDRRRCLDAGMDDYLSKPVRLETLRALIERAFTSRSPIDSGRILRLQAAGGDQRPDLWRELVQVYLEDTPELVEATLAAIESGARSEAGFKAHALKGTALNVGAQPLARVCAEIENLAQGSGDLAPLARRLHGEAERAQAHLLALLEE